MKYKVYCETDSKWEFWNTSDESPSEVCPVSGGHTVTTGSLARINGSLVDNLVATTDPGVNDDNTQGYGVGSKWINVTLDKGFIAVDVVTGVAVWMETTVVKSKTQTLSDGVNISWDMNDGDFATVILAGDRTLDNPTNLVNGGRYLLIIKQDATGSRTLAYGSAYKWVGGSVPVLSTGVNAIDILEFVSDGTNLYGVASYNFS